jgi:hypothetical protein
MSTETELVDKGLTEAEASPELAQEKALVQKWRKRIADARKHDEPARQQYAKDRRYARGDSGFQVDANIAGTNIDILESFLYAKDPDVDVLPSRAARPPSAEAIRDAAEETAGQRDPEVAQAGQMAAALAVSQGLPEDEAVKLGAMAENAVMEERITAEVEALRKRYRQRLATAKAFSETLEIVVPHLWRLGSLKQRGRPCVRSGATVGVGVLKGTWQERTEVSPESQRAINDLQKNIDEAVRLRAEMEEAVDQDYDAKLAEYKLQMDSLKESSERVAARGFVIDHVQSQNFQVAPGYTIANHLDAPWNAERIPMLRSDAKAEFNLDDDVIKQATGYRPIKQVMARNESPNILDASGEPMRDRGNAEDADDFTTEGGAGGDDCLDADWVMAWEIWDRTTGNALTMLDGINRWVKPPFKPTPTTRFYPYFLFTMSEVDGQRHPQSLISRASKLLDEYNRIGTAEAEHRRRIMPKILFDEGLVGPNQMKTIISGKTGEYVGVKRPRSDVPLANMFYELKYPDINPALYERQRLINEIERIFGVQEALSGAVTVAKTAREAEIQQGGFQARTGGRRDQLEAMLQDLAQYTAEVARKHLDEEDVREIAGPDAIWPEYTGPDDLNRLVQVEIRAGSSGKPNTTAEREAWATLLPLLQSGISQIAALRNSAPDDVADKYEALLQMTVDRSGDRIDIDTLVPRAGPPPAPVVPGAPGQPAPDGAPPQTPPAGALPVAA